MNGWQIEKEDCPIAESSTQSCWLTDLVSCLLKYLLTYIIIYLSLRGEIVHSLHCKRNPQQAKIRFVAEFATCYFSWIIYAVFDSTNKHLNHCTAQNRLKNRRNCGIRNCICGIQNSVWNPQTNDKTFVSLNWAVEESATVTGILKLQVESAFCLRIPFTYFHILSSL